VSYGSQIKAVQKANGGQASALNAGYAACRGDFILFLDADDVLLPNALANVVAMFGDASISNVHWSMWVIDSQGKRTGTKKPSQPPSEGDFREQLLQKGPSNLPCAPTSGNAWSRTFLERVMPIPEHVEYYRTCADEYLYTLAPAFGRLRTIAEPQSCYRIHGKNVYSSKTFREKLQVELSHYDEHCQAVSTGLRRTGVTVDSNRWKKHSWFHRLDQAIASIIQTVPEKATIALVDGDTWDVQGGLGVRRVIPFFQREGVDWGPPADCDAATAQLGMLLDEGTQFLAIGWPCLWWFEEYPKFFEVLGRHSICRVRNDAVVIYELASRTVTANSLSARVQSSVE
jgi:hypothetical protein